jgi:hypothetical protein
VKITRVANQYLRGEYWIINGQAIYADGDIGDMNHEGYVIQYAQNLISQEVNYDFDTEFSSWDGFKSDFVNSVLETERDTYESWQAGELEDSDVVNNDVFKILLKLEYSLEELKETSLDELADEYHHSNSDFIKEYVLMNNPSFDQELFSISDGNHSDARKYGMQKFGWIRFAGQNIETFLFTPETLSKIYKGMSSIFEEEGIEETENYIFNIEVISTRKFYTNIPFSLIENGTTKDIALYGGHNVLAKNKKYKIIRIMSRKVF